MEETTLQIAQRLAALKKPRRTSPKKPPARITNAQLLKISTQLQTELTGYMGRISALRPQEPPVKNHYQEVCRGFWDDDATTLAGRLAKPNIESPEMKALAKLEVSVNLADRLTNEIEEAIKKLKFLSKQASTAYRSESPQHSELDEHEKKLAENILKINQEFNNKLANGINLLSGSRRTKVELLNAQQIYLLRTLVPLNKPTEPKFR